jgi:hypothetical protein
MCWAPKIQKRELVFSNYVVSNKALGWNFYYPCSGIILRNNRTSKFVLSADVALERGELGPHCCMYFVFPSILSSYLDSVRLWWALCHTSRSKKGMLLLLH